MAFPSINALRSFDAAARLGSFKAAGEELGVSATAISHQIRGLEAQLGFALFERRTRQIILTEAGERLALSTIRAFRDLAEAVSDLREEGTKLTVTATPAFAALWLVPRLASFETRFPGIRVRVDSSTERVDLERDRRIDIAIRYGMAETAVQTHLVAKECFGAFAAPALLERNKDPFEAPLIATEWRDTGLQEIEWGDWFSAAGMVQEHQDRIRRFDQEHHVVQAGLAGQGLILASDLLVDDLVARGWLVAVRPNISVPGFAYSVLTRKGRPANGKIDRFITWLRDTIVEPT